MILGGIARGVVGVVGVVGVEFVVGFVVAVV